MPEGHQKRLEPMTLRGAHVALVPLAPAHQEALAAASREGALHRFPLTNVPEPDAVPAEIERRLALRDSGSMLPFAVLDGENTPVGMTSYMNIDLATPRLEIGSTWYAPRVQRTALNTEAKFLLLEHAFEVVGCLAVELRTHVLNQASRRAIERLGARLDGILRAHMLSKDGTVRDTCVYSITAQEWPAVRSHLRWQMERPRFSPA